MLFITFVMYSRQKPFQQVVPTDILFKIEILVRFLPIAFRGLRAVLTKMQN